MSIWVAVKDGNRSGVWNVKDLTSGNYADVSFLSEEGAIRGAAYLNNLPPISEGMKALMRREEEESIRKSVRG